jgi:hypothetical protein
VFSEDQFSKKIMKLKRWVSVVASEVNGSYISTLWMGRRESRRTRCSVPDYLCPPTDAGR